jgi:hypothetical protein
VKEIQEEENNVYVVIELLNMSQLLKGVDRGVKIPLPSIFQLIVFNCLMIL